MRPERASRGAPPLPSAYRGVRFTKTVPEPKDRARAKLDERSRHEHPVPSPGHLAGPKTRGRGHVCLGPCGRQPSVWSPHLVS